MASTVEAVPPSVQIENRGSTIQPFRGTRSRDRGGSRGGNRSANARGTQHSEQQFMNQQGGQRGGRQRGRGNRGNNQLTGRNSVGPQLSNSLNQPQPPLDPPPDLGGGGSFGVRLTKDAMKTEGEAGGKERGDEEDNEEVCFICASPVVHNSVAPCNHRTCHICALRLRALYKTRACAHCRVSFRS